MFEDYRSIRQPKSILDVVDRGIIQDLMQAFFFREKTGMTMLYDLRGAKVDGDGLVLQRLHPFADPKAPAAQAAKAGDSYSTFCQTLRADRLLDLACRRCDEEKATDTMRSASLQPVRYRCHMGLDDMRYPIVVASEVRAVLFAGQRLPKWDDDRIKYVVAQVEQKAAHHANKAALKRLLEPSNESEKAKSSQEAEVLWEAFVSFGNTIQHTVNKFYEAKLTLAHQTAQLEVSTKINATLTATPDDVPQPLRDILNQLAQLPEVGPLVVMTRRASRYIVEATTDDASDAADLHLPVHEVISFPAGQWHEINDGQGSQRLNDLRRQYFRDQPFTLYRIDAPNRDVRALSVLLLVQGKVPDSQRRLLGDCLSAIAPTAHVHALLGQMRQQQEILARTMTFTGHSMKTPISGALLSLNRIKRFSEGDDLPREEAGRIANALAEQLEEVLLDAWKFQATARAVAVPCNLYAILEGLRKIMEPLASRKSVTCVFSKELPEAPRVMAVEHHLRVALRNLLDNAIKYSYRHKEVRLYVRQVPTHEVILTITNYGVGVDPARLGDLFTTGARIQLKDAQEDRSGAGIGLVQAKAYIEESSGSLDLYSRKLDESADSPRSLITVTVTLPTVP